ncbi:aspartate aminotransferase family protein [Bradyrhizobium arachidis]|uniref:pyridoxal phosphate-dependent decarboxylase family protein n=1 Tax=Bradyrhizobium arachidis TaxID=858423 RepID=UPI00216391DF|nr:aspartate aminotransferase family protein [Bradyrhizobium arachidis]UVO35719.1 aspartate aminotransferase family protein [Bradyrhizobium arachidis]
MDITAMTKLPQDGTAWSELKHRLRKMKQDDYAWKAGRLPIFVYYYNEELLRVSQDSYIEFFSENALGRGKAFPSVGKLETEVIEMSTELLGGGPRAGGTFTSGGTESIFLALKTAREWARKEKGIVCPKIVMPLSGHAVADKAAGYLGMDVVRTPLRSDFRADMGLLRAAIDERTCMVYASAPGYPHGVFDPIEEIGALAKKRGVWFHVDACVGGFLAPFAREIGYHIPAFDLSVPGVCSLSADLHKYGFTPKGASLLLFAEREHQKYQRFEFSNWPRGAYVTDTFQGTRAAGPIASAWAVMNTLGHAGYREIARVIMDAMERLAAGIEQIRGLRIIRPSDLCILLYDSIDPSVDIYAVADCMDEKGWYVGKSAVPKAIHIALNPVVVTALDNYLFDLAACVEHVRSTPGYTPASVSAPAIS